MSKTILFYFFFLGVLSVSGQKCTDFKKTELIHKCCNSILEVDPENYECNIFKGDHFLNEDIELDLAIKYFSAAILKSPDSIKPYFGRFEAYYLAEDYKNAINDLENIKEKYENVCLISPFILNYSGLVNLNLGNYKEAYFDFKNANKYFTDAGFEDDPDYLIGMANAKDRLNDKSEALEILNRAVILDTTGRALGERALHFIGIGNTQLAYVDFETAIAKRNPTYNTLVNYSLFLNSQGQSKKAVEFLKKCISTFPKEYLSYEVLGFLYFADKNYVSAKSTFNSGIEIFPAKPNLVFGYGLSCFNNNEKMEGCSYFRKAKEMGHDDADNMIKNYCR